MVEWLIRLKIILKYVAKIECFVLKYEDITYVSQYQTSQIKLTDVLSNSIIKTNETNTIKNKTIYKTHQNIVPEKGSCK